MNKAEQVVGCVECGKPVVLVGDSLPAPESCPWCCQKKWPGAFDLFLKDVKRAAFEDGRKSVLGDLNDGFER